MNRTTLQREARLEGAGLFSGQRAGLRLTPALDSTGIVFVHGGTPVPARIEYLSSAPAHPAFARLKPRCTSVAQGGVNIATIEHVLSALAGLGITDARIEIDSAHPHCEVPIMDGSALGFVDSIRGAGVRTLGSGIEPITVSETIRVVDGDASITIEPADAPAYAYTLDYGAPGGAPPPIPAARVAWGGDPDDYARRIAPARTFCLAREADAMRSAGLFAHLSAGDMLVIGERGPIDNTLRDPSECALHKLLDLIGDLALVGAPVRARIEAVRSGHALAHRAARALAEQNLKRS